MDHRERFEELESNVRSYCRETPNLFVSARGARVWDEAGNEFIDFLSACGSLNYGHNHPEIKRAIMDYIEADGIGTSLDFHTRAKLRFIELFREIVLEPRGLKYKLQFTGPTGTNCVEAALKLAKKATGRSGVVAFTNAFHGMSMGALAATGAAMPKRGLEIGTGVVRLPFDDYHGAGVDDLRRFRQMASDPSGGLAPIAAMIVETVQGEGGLNVASAEWLRELRETATALGAVMIVDDVQAGCGRTGEFFSFDRADVAPDMVCLAKSIGGGLPMSLLLVRPELDVWRPGEHNGTFRGNNLAFVAGAAALGLWQSQRFLDDLKLRSATLTEWTTRMVRRYSSHILRAKGIGMMSGIEFRCAEFAARVAEIAREKNVLIERCGPWDQVLKILAPLNIDEKVFAVGLNRLQHAIQEAIDEDSDRAAA